MHGQKTCARSFRLERPSLFGRRRLGLLGLQIFFGKAVKAISRRNFDKSFERDSVAAMVEKGLFQKGLVTEPWEVEQKLFHASFKVILSLAVL